MKSRYHEANIFIVILELISYSIYHFVYSAMLVRLFVLLLMLSVQGNFGSKVNPLNGQHIRIVAMEVRVYIIEPLTEIIILVQSYDLFVLLAN